MEGRREKPACFIVGAGSFEGFLTPPQKGDLVIAADGGYVHLKKQGIEPDVLMGDFDSLDQVPDRELIRHSPMKDDTDMALAVAYARERGFVWRTGRQAGSHTGEPPAFDYALQTGRTLPYDRRRQCGHGHYKRENLVS